MATYYSRPTNGVSYGVKYTVTSGAATDGFVLFDFRSPVTSGTVSAYRYDLVANIEVLNASGVVTNPANLAWTYPSYGTVRVAGTLVAGSTIQLVAQRAN